MAFFNEIEALAKLLDVEKVWLIFSLTTNWKKEHKRKTTRWKCHGTRLFERWQYRSRQRATKKLFQHVSKPRCHWLARKKSRNKKNQFLIIKYLARRRSHIIQFYWRFLWYQGATRVCLSFLQAYFCRFDIIFKQIVGSNDVFLGIDPERNTSSTACDALVIKIQLPKQKSIQAVNLDVGKNSLLLTSAE